MEPNNVEGYFHNVQLVLSQYAWLFNFKMTHVLEENIFDAMPSEWVEFGKGATLDALHDIAEGNAKV